MNKILSWAIAIVVISVALNPIALRAQDNADEAAIRKLVEQLFAAHQKKDLEGAMACWSATSPQFAGYKKFAQNEFDVIDGTQFVNVTFTRWKIEANRAFVRLRYDRKARLIATNQSAQQTTILDVQFVKEADNWKFWQNSNPFTRLAGKLIAAKTKDERAELLKNEKEIVTRDLVEALNNAAVSQASQGKFDDAIRINDISLEAAEILGESAGKAECYLARGIIFSSQFKRPEALESFQRALRLFQDAKDNIGETWVLVSLGETYEGLTRYAEALTHYEAGLKLVRELGEKRVEAATLNSIGNVYRSTGRYSEALARYEASLKITQASGDKAGEAAALNNIGVVYNLTGKYADALAQLEASLKISRASGLKTVEAAALNNIGNAYRLTGKYADALTHHNAGLKMARELGDKAEEARTLANIGTVYNLTGKYANALARYEASLKITRELGDKAVEGEVLVSIGNVYSSTSKYADALAQFEASLKIARELGNKAGEAAALQNIGVLYPKTGKYKEGLEQLEASLKMMRELNDREGEALALVGIGNVYQSTSKYADALAQFEAALKITRGLGDKAAEAATLTGIGNVHSLTGRYAEALAHFGAGLKIVREIGNKAGEADVLNNIGAVYNFTGKYAEAVAQLEASLKMKREIGDKAGEASAFGNIGYTYLARGKYAEALAQFEASLKIVRELNDKAGEATTLISIGAVYQLTGKYSEALVQIETSLKMVREMGDKAEEARALANLGFIYQLTGKYSEALVQVEASLKIRREIGDKAGEGSLLAITAAVYRSQKQWQQAADTYRKAIPLIELTRTQTREPSLQTSFFAQYTPIYYGLIDTLLELGSGRDEAFAVSEQAKARTLVELMAGGKVNVLKSMTKAEQQKEQDLNASLIATTAQLYNASLGSTPDHHRIAELNQQLNKARDDYEEFRRQLFIAHPELQTQRASFNPLSLAQLTESLFAREPDFCLLSYIIGDDKTLLFVITGGKDANSPPILSVHTLKTGEGGELTADELRRRLNEFKLRYTNESGIYKQSARDLYKVLLAPAEKELKGKSHVVIIPDGILHALPFQALIDQQDKHFIETHSVSYAPSITALVQMMKLADRKKKTNTSARLMFAMGRRAFPDQSQYRNQELSWAEEQVKSIADLFGVSPLTGREATKAKARLEMDKARYVHFATHGELNEFAPMYSAIVLGKSADDDGMLYARELVDMDLEAELVVLSACDTGLGQAVNGEGIVGLTWALFVAGAPSSVVTQWKVRDDSMNRLMLEFYRQMKLAGSNGQKAISKGEALRRAQWGLMRNDAYKHPYHWAPVALVGDWR